MTNPTLNETSLSRVWKYVNDKNTTIAILSGFRDEYTPQENKQRNVTIAMNLKKAGFGYFYVIWLLLCEWLLD